MSRGGTQALELVEVPQVIPNVQNWGTTAPPHRGPGHPSVWETDYQAVEGGTLLESAGLSLRPDPVPVPCWACMLSQWGKLVQVCPPQGPSPSALCPIISSVILNVTQYFWGSINLKNKLATAKGRTCGGGRPQEFGISRCKLLHIEWTGTRP